MPRLLESNRLRAVLSHVLPGERMADIGTDHALLPVAAVSNGTVPFAIGIDRAPRALDAGRRHVVDYDVADRIDLRLGEGLAPLRPDDEISTVVMAGVGAQTLVDVMDTQILSDLCVDRLVLQPNRSEIDARQAVFQTAGWRLEDETLVEDRGRFYVVLSVDMDADAPSQSLDDVALEDQLLGPYLRCRNPGHLACYARRLAGFLEPYLETDGDDMPPEIRRRLERRLEVFRAAGE